MNCQICNELLTPAELNLSRAWHFECAKCQICNAEGLQDDRIELCLRDKIPVSHLGCWQHKVTLDIRNKAIVITKSHLKEINRLMIPSEWRLAEVEQGDIDKMMELIKLATSVAVNVSQCLGAAKERMQGAATETYRREQTEKRETERAAQRETEADKARRAAERANPELRTKRKAIESLMNSYGLTAEAAEALLQKKVQ